MVVAGLVASGAASRAAESEEVYTPNHHDVVRAAMQPTWIARGTAIYVDRASEGPLSLIESTTNQGQQLNADAFNFDHELRYDLSLTRLAWYDGGFELRYLDFGELAASTSVPVSNSIVQINSSPPVFAPNVQSIDARYTTDFYSIELNYFYPMYDFLTVLVGFRYINFDDEIRAVLDATPQTFFFDAGTRNDLYGGQLGLITVPYCPLFGLWISSYGKIGIYANDAENRSRLDTGLTQALVNATADNSAVVGEFAIQGELPIHPHVSIFGGYNLLFLERVAVASDQVVVTDFFNGTGSNDNGGVLFHGASLSLEIRL